MSLLGIHHVTAFAGEPQVNHDFFTRVLGLRFIKQTVNFDDIEHYHLYYADRTGSPGTVLTYFSHPNARPGQHGSGQVASIHLGIPPGAGPFWAGRLKHLGIAHEQDSGRAAALRFSDPDGTSFTLTEHPVSHSPDRLWTPDGMRPEQVISAFAGLTLRVAEPEPTVAFLKDVLGFEPRPSAGDGAGDGTGASLHLPRDEHHAFIEVVADPAAGRGRFGPGVVHHVAWRVADSAALVSWQARLAAENLNVTEIRERKYFRSIYFREPGGIVFELATDGPGFTEDESEAELGRTLQLPEWLEARRARIAGALPPLEIDPA